MSAASPATDLFARHYVDLQLSGAVGRVAGGLSAAGLVTVDRLTTRSRVLGFAAQVMRVVHHRDSGADGVTAIYNTGRHDERPGFAGLTNGELALHTEGAALQSPPRLMLMVCTQPAPEGGHSLLLDGHTIHAELEQRCPDAMAVLSGPRAGFFGPSTGIFAPVFARHEDGRVAVRYRQNGLVCWSPLAQMHLHSFWAAAKRNQQMLTLKAGQGYLLDNHRWLHGRTAFDGARRCYRALGNPHEPAPPGFLPRSTGGGAA